MSMLPAGSKAAGQFAESAISKGVGAVALSLYPALFTLPIIGAIATKILNEIIARYLSEPLVTEATKYALAGAYAADRAAFDKQFIYLKTLDKQNTSPAEIEKALADAENAMEKFVRRGPLS